MDRSGIYIAGSDMNAGKTTLSLGLIAWLEEREESGAAFMKPLGQKTTLLNGQAVGEDTFLVNTSLGLDIPLEYTAPFAMSSGVSENYLSHGKPDDIGKKIRTAFRYLKSENATIVVEGTGHPGVGSVFDLDNADVAKLLGIPVVLVLNGGIGKTIDRFTLCMGLFRQKEVPVLGVIINRVLESKLEKVRKYLDPWFSEMGVPVFGYIPYVSSLCRPSIEMMGRELGVETIVKWEKKSGSLVEGFVGGFGSTSEIISDIEKKPESALLLSTGRIEVVDAIVSRRVSGQLEKGPGAIVLCGKDKGDTVSYISNVCSKMEIPLYRSPRSTGDSVSILNKRIFKVEPGESVKISEIVKTIKEHVDVEGLFQALQTSDSISGAGRDRSGSRIRKWFSRLFGKS